MTQKIFVFGSNLAGRHGAGAALMAANQYGAKRGVGEGLTEFAYAIPTKDRSLRVLGLDQINVSVRRFIRFANEHQGEMMFIVTRIGCGLAGYTDQSIAPMFDRAPDNCLFDEKWKPWLGDAMEYWGTY